MASKQDKQKSSPNAEEMWVHEHQYRVHQQEDNDAEYNDQKGKLNQNNCKKIQSKQFQRNKYQTSYLNQFALKEIDRANLALARRIVNVQNRRQSQKLCQAQPRMKREGSAGINRRRKLTKIAVENIRMAERLGNITVSSNQTGSKTIVYHNDLLRDFSTFICLESIPSSRWYVQSAQSY